MSPPATPRPTDTSTHSPPPPSSPTTSSTTVGETPHKAEQTYPGAGVLSEPETAAIWNFITTLPNKLGGLLDVHTYATSVMRPYSNQFTESPEPYKSKLIKLGQSMEDAIQTNSKWYKYDNGMGAFSSALANGTFKDAVFMELGNVPAYNIELEGMEYGFISPQSLNRDVSNRTLACFVAFSEGIEQYWHGL